MIQFDKSSNYSLKGFIVCVISILIFGFSITSQAEMVITLMVSGQAQPQLTDPDGNVLGVNIETRKLERGIVDARLSLGANRSYMEILNPLTGRYSLVLNGSYEENLIIRLNYSDNVTGVNRLLSLQTLFHGEPIAFSFDFDSANNNPLILIPPAGLPTDLDINNNEGNVRLTWTHATDAKVLGYRIYGRLQQYPFFQLLGESSGSFYDTTHPIRSSDEGDHWKYVVLGITEDGQESFYSTVLNNRILLSAFFDADVRTGSVPLTVAFSDNSIGSPTSWAWDFDNDGVDDSIEQNPIFTYDTPGIYTVRLTVSNSIDIDDILQTDYIIVIVDNDNDGIDDAVDNCPSVANTDQEDTNGDGIGDACQIELVPGDLDSDADVDTNDFYLFLASFGSCEGDVMYNSDADFDTDGCITFVDYQTFYGYYVNQ